MPHSHHSHSGQFCAHATCTLEEMVQQAISLKMDTFALTEHIPRDTADLYPEEVDAQKLIEIFDAYYPEALRLREKYASQITILIGFEGEWIRPSSHTIIKDLLSRYKFDFFVGSIHHTLTKPIDFDHDMYYEARTIAGGSDEDVFAAFFDEQYDMLKALTPPLVGHFDLIRLKSDNPERNWTTMPAVWEKIVRNLDFVASYGGILELNSSAIRKGMSEPYPKAEEDGHPSKSNNKPHHYQPNNEPTLDKELLDKEILGDNNSELVFPHDNSNQPDFPLPAWIEDFDPCEVFLPTLPSSTQDNLQAQISFSEQKAAIFHDLAEAIETRDRYIKEKSELKSAEGFEELFEPKPGWF
ncbi:histidinol phosphatase [Aureobasidium pullulans]|nr:histidinol phosphatase [Aureobasidium pullulans]